MEIKTWTRGESLLAPGVAAPVEGQGRPTGYQHVITTDPSCYRPAISTQRRNQPLRLAPFASGVPRLSRAIPVLPRSCPPRSLTAVVTKAHQAVDGADGLVVQQQGLRHIAAVHPILRSEPRDLDLIHGDVPICIRKDKV